MATKLFVGSLPYSIDDKGLEDFFSEIGEVTSATVIFERETGRSKGFGFVEMSSDEDAKKAISELNGKELEGRKIIVNEARPKENRPNNFSDRGGFRQNRR
jgi:cold-inducible RNA-binding protein